MKVLTVSLFLLFAWDSFTEERPLNWLDHYRTCFQRLDGGTVFSDVDMEKALTESKSYSFFPGTHNGQGGYWAVYNGMGTFVIVPSGRTPSILMMWGGKTKGGQVKIPGGKTLYFTGRMEEQTIYKGSSQYQLEVTSTPQKGYSYSNTAGSSHILDESIRPDIEDAIVSKVKLIFRLTHAPLAQDLDRATGRTLQYLKDEKGNFVESPPPKLVPHEERLLGQGSPPDSLLDKANRAQVYILEECLKDLRSIQPQPDRVINAIQNKLRELNIPQLPVQPDGSRGTPQAT